MVYVLLGAVLGLIPSGLLLYLMIQQNKTNLLNQENWVKEREALLNRCMTREWQSYQMMQVPMQGLSGLTSESYLPGMNDEEELRRIGEDLSNIRGIGDVYAEIEADATELGIRPE